MMINILDGKLIVDRARMMGKPIYHDSEVTTVLMHGRVITYHYDDLNDAWRVKLWAKTF